MEYKRQENGCGLLDTRDNGDIIGFDEESVNSVGDMDV